MGANDNTSIKSQEERFTEYLQLHGVDKVSDDIQHLKEAFLVECQVLFQLANKCWPGKSFSHEEAMDCVLIALKNKDSNNKVKFLPNVFISLYDEITNKKVLSDKSLSVIQSDWGIITNDRKIDEPSLEIVGELLNENEFL